MYYGYAWSDNEIYFTDEYHSFTAIFDTWENAKTVYRKSVFIQPLPSSINKVRIGTWYWDFTLEATVNSETHKLLQKRRDYWRQIRPDDGMQDPKINDQSQTV